MGYYFLMIGSNLLLTLLFKKLEKKEKIQKINTHLRQLVIGLVFGTMAILGTITVSWVSIPLANVRDSFVITAGLLFGGEASIIAGVMASVYRFFFAYGDFTRISCTVTTLVAGLVTALMRKLFFKEKCPTLVLSFLFTISIAAFHMAMIFLTHSTNLSKAYETVHAAWLGAMTANAASVMFSVLLYRLDDFATLKKMYLKRKKKIKNYSRWFIISIVFFLSVSFILVGYFIFYTHTKYSSNSLRLVFNNAILDVQDHVNRYGSDVTQSDIIREFDRYNMYLIDDFLLVNKEDNSILNTVEVGNADVFPLDKCYQEGEINDTNFCGNEYYFMYESYGDYYIVVTTLKSDITFFRDATVYMVGLLNAIIFSILFFMIYILVKTFVISNLREVIEEVMIAKGESVKKEEFANAKFFVPITEELDYTFRLLYENNRELTGKMKEEHAKKEKYEYLADHDKLTGLLNREGFRKMVSKSCYNNKNLAFIFIDVDKFKEINDTYGHQVGDGILQKISGEIIRNSRSDDIIMRYGGDEFAMILMGCKPSEKDMIMRKIMGINKRLKITTDNLPKVSISAGCAFSDMGYNKDVMERADMALYTSKANGRGRCSFYNE